MRFLKFFLRYKNPLVIILTPLVFIPLLFLSEPCVEGPEYDNKAIKTVCIDGPNVTACSSVCWNVTNDRWIEFLQKNSKAGGVTQLGGFTYCLAWMAVWWILEPVDIAVTSLLPMVIFPLFGVLSAGNTAGSYMKDIIMLFMGGLIIALAITKTNLHKRIALTSLKIVGGNKHLLMLSFQIVTWFLSMWISNTATTAMIMPIAESIFKQLEKTRGIERNPGDNPRKGLDKVTKTFFIGLTLAIPHSANIGGMATITGTPPNLVMANQMMDSFPNHAPELTFSKWFEYAFPQSVIYMILAYIWLSSFYLGWTGPIKRLLKKETELERVEREREENDVKNIVKNEYKKLPPLKKRLGEMIVIVLFFLMAILFFFRRQGTAGSTKTWGWGQLSVFRSKFCTDSTVAMGIAILLFLLPAKVPPSFKKWETSKPTPTILSFNPDMKDFPWGVVLLIGGGYALSEASKISGFSQWLVIRLEVLRDLDPWLIALIITMIAGFATEFSSNTATAHLFMPLIAQLSIAIRVNPYLLMMPMTLATSLAFMLPVATPPNAIAFSYGRIKIRDMALSGFVMNLVGFGLVTLLIGTYGKTILGVDLNSFPTWADV